MNEEKDYRVFRYWNNGWKFKFYRDWSIPIFYDLFINKHMVFNEKVKKMIYLLTFQKSIQKTQLKASFFTKKHHLYPISHHVLLKFQNLPYGSEKKEDREESFYHLFSPLENLNYKEIENE